MRSAPNFKAINFIPLLILFIFFERGISQNSLNDIIFKGKDNGILVEFNFQNPISSDSIYAWQSDNEWFYFTLHNVFCDTLLLNKNTNYDYPILEFQPIINDRTTQIGLRLKNKVESFEFYERNQKNLINAHLHYSLDKFKELPLADRKYEKNKEFDNLFFRSKSWLFLIGTGYTLSGLLSENENNLQIGISTILITFLFNKIWSSE